jgi:hypothetical protein
VARAEVTGRKIGVPKRKNKDSVADIIIAKSENARGSAKANTKADAADADVPSSLSLIKSPPKQQAPPRSHHLDKRASVIADSGAGDPDDLLTSRDVAHWLGVTEQWVETGRVKNYGPPFTRLSPKVIRYRRGDIVKWLRSRTHGVV